MDFLWMGLLYAGILGVQYVLSSQKNVYLGAVVPLLFSAGMTWRYVNVESVSTMQYLLITGFALFGSGVGERPRGVSKKSGKRMESYENTGFQVSRPCIMIRS